PISRKRSRAPTRACCKSGSMACSIGATSAEELWLSKISTTEGTEGTEDAEDHHDRDLPESPCPQRPPRWRVFPMKYSVITFGCRVNQADSLGFEEDPLARGG